MARDYYISGPALVRVKGAANSVIATLSELGLSDTPIQPTLTYKHTDLSIDAFGGVAGVPPDVQWMGAEMTIPMTLIHFDLSILRACIRESAAGAAADGTLIRAGKRVGNNLPRFDAGNHYVSLNITSPDGGLPWRFLTCYLAGQPVIFPLGVERTGVILSWRAIPYQQDPYGGGTGMEGAVLYDHQSDS